MSDKKFSIEAVFKAIDNFTRPMKSMTDAAGRMAKQMTKGLSQVNTLNDKVLGGVQKLVAATTVAAGLTAVGVAGIIATGKEFDKTLVAAAAKFDPALKRGTAGFEELRVAAERIGEATEFNAQQGAQALKDLAASGFDVKTAIASLPGIVDLATAAEVDLGVASEIASQSLGAFNLKSADSIKQAANLARVSDVLAMAAGKTDASMEGLFESIKEGGPVATSVGASIETFSALAARLASNSIHGSTAGTTLKNVFLAFAAPTKEAAGALETLGIKTKDTNGNMRDVVMLLSDLEKKTKAMGSGDRAAILERIFGKIPIAGLNALLTEGTDKTAQLRAELENAAGATKSMAATMRDTVAGDLDGLSSAIDGVKISIFSMNSGAIRGVIQGMTQWVAANKEFVTTSILSTVKKIGDNLPAIYMWTMRIAAGIAVYYALSTGLRVAAVAVDVFQIAMSVASGIGILFAALTNMQTYRIWLFNAAMFACQVVTWAQNAALAAYNGVVWIGTIAYGVWNALTGTGNVVGAANAAITWVRAGAQGVWNFITGIGVGLLAAYNAGTLLSTTRTGLWAIAVGAATAVQGAFNAVMAMNPMFLLGLAIVGVIAAVVKFSGLWDFLKDKVVSFGGRVLDALGPVGAFIKGLGSAIGFVADQVGSLLGGDGGGFNFPGMPAMPAAPGGFQMPSGAPGEAVDRWGYSTPQSQTPVAGEARIVIDDKTGQARIAGNNMSGVGLNMASSGGF